MRYPSPALRLLLLFAVCLVWSTPAVDVRGTSTSQEQCSLEHCLFLPIVRTPEVVRIADATRAGSCKGFCIGVEGHIQNLAATPVYSVTLKADFYDQHGALVETRTFPAALAAIFPGELSPFRILFLRPLDLYDYDYKLTVEDWTLRSSLTYQPLTVISKHVRWYSTEIERVSGEIRNDSRQAVRTVRVIVSYSSGDYSTIELTSELAPGESAEYSTESLIYRGWWLESEVRVQAQGVLAP